MLISYAGRDGRDGQAGRSVDDVNECMTRNGDCQDICINTVGGFYCACGAGQVLSDPATVTCDGKLFRNVSMLFKINRSIIPIFQNTPA